MTETMETKVLALADQRWADFVAATPRANVFHHPAWTRLLADCYGYHPFVLAVCDSRGGIQAGLPIMEVDSPLTGLRWIALPFTDKCLPLHAGAETPPALFTGLTELQSERAVPRVELRGAVTPDLQAYHDTSHVEHVLPLSPDSQVVLRSFRHNHVQSIAKAERSGVHVRQATSMADLTTYYALHWRTRQRLGVPVQSKRYFDLLWRQIIEPGLGFISLAYYDALPIAGAVFLTYKTTLICKYAASDSDYWRLRPNNLLFWTAIHWGCEHGYTSFDWGKTEVANTGLRQFKRGWGAEETSLTYTILCDTPPRAGAGRLAHHMEPLIRRSPACCRVIGELLYRHFA